MSDHIPIPYEREWTKEEEEKLVRCTCGQIGGEPHHSFCRIFNTPQQNESLLDALNKLEAHLNESKADKQEGK